MVGVVRIRVGGRSRSIESIDERERNTELKVRAAASVEETSARERLAGRQTLSFAGSARAERKPARARTHTTHPSASAHAHTRIHTARSWTPPGQVGRNVASSSCWPVEVAWAAETHPSVRSDSLNS